MIFKYKIIDSCRELLNKYTRQAYEFIPQIDQSRILDLGCGTGVPGLEIAGLSGADMTAVDHDRRALSWLNQKVKVMGIAKQVTTLLLPLEGLNLPQNSYDIILAEGIFHILGFERGIQMSMGFLKSPGFMMIHDEWTSEKEHLNIFLKYNLEVISSFGIDENGWKEYFNCLTKEISNLNKNERNDIFAKELSEIQMFKSNPERFRSIYYVVKKP